MHQDPQEAAFATDATLEVSIRTATSNEIEDVLALVRVCIGHLRSRGIAQWDEVYPDQNTIERQTFLASNARETVGAIVLTQPSAVHCLRHREGAMSAEYMVERLVTELQSKSTSKATN